MPGASRPDPSRPSGSRRSTWPGLCSGEASPRGCVTCRWRAGSAGTRIILIDGFLGNLPAACQAIPQQKSATVRSLYLRTCSSVGGSSSTRRKTLARLHQPSGHERGGGVQLGQRKDEEEGSNYSSWSGVPCRGEGQRKCHGWIGFGCRWPTAAFRSQEGGLDAVLAPAINERHLDRARWITDDRKSDSAEVFILLACELVKEL